MSLIAEVYDRLAPAYAAAYRDPVSRAEDAVVAGVVEQALEAAPATGYIIDLGCGSGQLFDLLGSSGYLTIGSYAGWDLSPAMIAQARARYPGWAFSVGDALHAAWYVQDHAARAVVSLYAVNYLSPVALQALLARWHQRMKPGARLVVVAATARRWRRPTYSLRNGSASVARPLTSRELLRAARPYRCARVMGMTLIHDLVPNLPARQYVAVLESLTLGKVAPDRGRYLILEATA